MIKLMTRKREPNVVKAGKHMILNLVELSRLLITMRYRMKREKNRESAVGYKCTKS